MAVSFGAAGTGANGTPSIPLPHPASLSAGMLITAFLWSLDATGSTPVPTGSGWTLQGTAQNTDGTLGASAGPRRMTIYTKVSDGTESGTNETFTITGGLNSALIGIMYRWSKTLAAWVIDAAVDAYGNAEGAQTSLTLVPDVELDTGRIVAAGWAGPDDAQAISGQTLTAAGFTFGAVTELLDQGSTLGHNTRLHGFRAAVATGTLATVTLGCTFTQDESGAMVALVLGDSAGQTVAIGQASETDTALAVTPVGGSATAVIGIASETDTALTVTPTGTVAVQLGVASETDTALAVTPMVGVASVQLGVATETDTALAVTALSGATLALGVAAETDTALAITPVPDDAVAALGVAAETDTALGVTAVPGAGTVTLGIAAETDTALAVTAANGTAPVVLGLAIETDTALAVTIQPGQVVVQTGVAAETDTALAFGAAITQQREGAGMGGYRGLQAIIEVAAAERRAELAAPPAACPNHGDPLEKGPDGVLSCPLGDYVHGFRPPRPPMGMR